MQYFVALEDIKELRWQVELLYESIRLLGLQDHFLVAISPFKGSTVYKHHFPNVFYFDNMGRKLGFPHFNKCYAMARAIETGVLKQPFVALDTDMFLLRELPQSKLPVAAQFRPHLSWDNVSHELKDIAKITEWRDIGGVYQFNNVPGKVFEDIVKYTHDLHHQYHHVKMHTYGFNLGIGKNEIKVEKRNDFEMPLMYDGSPSVDWSSCVVHYTDGYIPYFHKRKVFETINFSFNAPLPMKVILDAPTKNQANVIVMQTLIRSWLDSNLTRVWDLI